MALYSLYCADVLLRNCSLTLTPTAAAQIWNIPAAALTNFFASLAVT